MMSDQKGKDLISELIVIISIILVVTSYKLANLFDIEFSTMIEICIKSAVVLSFFAIALSVIWRMRGYPRKPTVSMLFGIASVPTWQIWYPLVAELLDRSHNAGFQFTNDWWNQWWFMDLGWILLSVLGALSVFLLSRQSSLLQDSGENPLNRTNDQ